MNACAWRDLAGLAVEGGSLLATCRQRAEEAAAKDNSDDSAARSLERASKKRKLSSSDVGTSSRASTGHSKSSVDLGESSTPSAPGPADPMPLVQSEQDGDEEPEEPGDAKQAVVHEQKTRAGKKKPLTIKQKLDLLKKFEAIRESGIAHPEKAQRIRFT